MLLYFNIVKVIFIKLYFFSFTSLKGYLNITSKSKNNRIKVPKKATALNNSQYQTGFS